MKHMDLNFDDRSGYQGLLNLCEYIRKLGNSLVDADADEGVSACPFI